MTARGNLVAVITNGTAVLGLGAIGPLAAKPVMEGKGVLFKKFAVSTCLIWKSTSAIPTSWWTSLPRWNRLRRHQSGRHQIAGMLLHRTQAAREDEDSGVP